TGGRFRLHERGGDARLRADRAGDRLEPVEHAPRPRPGPPDGDRRHLRRDLARGGEPRPRPSGDPRDRGGDHRAFISCPPGATTLIVARPSLSPNGRETWDRFSAGPWSAGPRPGRFQRPPGRGRTDRRRSANARGPSYPEPPPSRGGPNDPALAPGPSGGSSGPPVLAAAGRPPPERPARSAGLFRRGYRGREAARASDPPRERAVPHAREPALPSGGGGQRPRVRRPAREPRPSVRRGRLRDGPPGACVHRRSAEAPPVVRGTPGRTGGPGTVEARRGSRAPLHGRRRRGEGRGQAAAAHELPRTCGFAPRRGRPGLPVPACPERGPGSDQGRGGAQGSGRPLLPASEVGGDGGGPTFRPPH